MYDDAALAKLAREAAMEFRERCGAWIETGQEPISRLLIAATDEVLALADAGKYEQAKGAMIALMVGVKAAGPEIWGHGL